MRMPISSTLKHQLLLCDIFGAFPVSISPLLPSSRDLWNIETSMYIQFKNPNNYLFFEPKGDLVLTFLLFLLFQYLWGKIDLNSNLSYHTATIGKDNSTWLLVPSMLIGEVLNSNLGYLNANRPISYPLPSY